MKHAHILNWYAQLKKLFRAFTSPMVRSFYPLKAARASLIAVISDNLMGLEKNPVLIFKI